ncbi:M48 family metalloprotease [Sphingomonas morindae]|uniref:M48 family metalloprotease n=1 Tax=Sphingomonas morindae TaxID=1541170 RepID=A0ABY4XBF6_9SPHN|nr:M48 family metalloprotease [Sphingomonas morindae]USI74308.1 M48 family metalloprotease [Sphingomonas morindae]
MTAFDPDAATAAYLATLPAAAHAKALAYTRGSEWLILWNWAADMLAAWLILKSGMLARLRTRFAARPNRAAWLVALVYYLAAFALTLPWAVYAQWARERAYGLSTQGFGGWLGDALLSTAISALVLSLVAIAVYALMRRTPRRWWAWSGLVVAAMVVVLLVIGPVAIEPLFNRYRPAPPGPTRDAIVALAQRAGVPSDKILVYDGSKQSERYTANVSGLFGTARVAMSDTMTKQGADLAEVRGVVGHEMGHYRHYHALIGALVMSLIAVALLWGTDRLFAPAARLLGARGLGGIADPAGLPVLVMVALTLGLIATPLMNGWTRTQESDADRFSLRVAHEPDGLSRALVKTIAYRAATPNPIEEMLFYDHPSVARRIHAAMLWKARHPDEVGR